MSVSEIFKTEFKGYNKKEVIDYIETLNSQLESLKAELDRTESELEKCIAELREADNAQQASVQDSDAVRREIRDELRAEITEQVRAELAAENNAASENDELEALRAKAAMYDEQKEIIAELMIKAKTDAADIYKDAEDRSNALLMDTFDKFIKARDDFSQMRKNIESGKAEMDSRIAAVSHYLSDFSRYLDILEQDIANTGKNFKQNI